MKIPKLFNLSLVTLVIWLVLAGVTFAFSITYTFTGTGSGTVNSLPFTNAVYTITLYGDTTEIIHHANNDYALTATKATMAITGVGTATVTDTVWIFDGPNVKWLGIGRNGPGNMLVLKGNEAFATYDLATALDPITSSASLYDPFQNLQTNLGPISLSSSSGTVTFQAVLGSPPVTWSTGEVSISLQITSVSADPSGNIKFKKSSGSLTGTIEMYISDMVPQPGADGCYVKFAGADGSKICATQINTISTDVQKSRSEQALLVGTGTMTMMFGESLASGIAYLDVKATLKKDSSGEVSAISLSGKIGGSADEFFVLTGNIRTTLTK